MKDKKLNRLLMSTLGLCGLLYSCGSQAETQLLEWGSRWKYVANGESPGVEWYRSGFDDSAWPSGNGLLGFGDPDIVTTLPDQISGTNLVTRYFRHSLVLDKWPIDGRVRLDLMRDDGAVVYLNGTEVLRDNMPPGNPGPETLASSAIWGNAERTAISRTLDASVLTGHTNLIAVEIHQVSRTSSDVAFDLALVAVPQLATNASAARVVRGPYLQSGTPVGMTVCWRTDLSCESFVWYAAHGSTDFKSVFCTNAVIDHKVRIEGLCPGTRYSYGVGAGSSAMGSMASNPWFVTSPEHGSRGPTRIWLIGDSGTANQDARNVRDYMYSWSRTKSPDIWIMLGDNAYYHGTDEQYQSAVFDIYPEMLRQHVLWPTLGNHDGASADSATQTGVYYDIFSLPRRGEAGGLASGTEAYYAFDYANVHFVCLDSFETDRSVDGAMLTWLKNDLTATRQDWIVAFFHHPPYTKGSHNSDVEIELIEMRQNALPILEDGGADLVLSGHSHSYERSTLIHGHYGVSGTFSKEHQLNAGSGVVEQDGPYNVSSGTGTVYVVAGSSGKISGGALNHPVMYASLNELGSVMLDIHADRMDVHFLGTNRVLDTFTVLKKNDISP